MPWYLQVARLDRSEGMICTWPSLFFGTVSGSGTGPLDYGATGPVPETEPRL